MKIALFAAALVGLVIVVSSRDANETGKQADREIRDVAHVLERAVQNAPPPRPAPPTGQWIPRVNAECVRREMHLEALPGPGGVDQIAHHAQEVLDIHRRYARRVAELKPPLRFRTEAATINRLNARQVQVLTRVAAATRAGHISGASSQARSLRVLAGHANLQFLRLGLPQCPFTSRSMPL